jgi:hypothetical protein
MASTPPKPRRTPAKLARCWPSGDVTTAVSLVRNNISGGVRQRRGLRRSDRGLNQAGLTGEAQNLLSNPQLQAAVRRRSWRAFAMAM